MLLPANKAETYISIPINRPVMKQMIRVSYFKDIKISAINRQSCTHILKLKLVINVSNLALKAIGV